MTHLLHIVHFLCIGAQKAGTTWLWSILRSHPHIWLAPLKELHYFDRSLNYLSPSILAADGLFERLFSRAPHNYALRHQCWTQLSRAIHLRDWVLARWYVRYYFGGRDDRWYLSLFEKCEHRVRGEITPAYSMLDLEDVARVKRLLPHGRIIFLLRNPIERAWSHVRFEAMQGRFRGIEDFHQARQLLERPGFILRGDYLRTLDCWTSQFPGEQMFIGFFDDIKARPTNLLREILSFLGLGSDLLVSPLPRKSNASPEIAMPPHVHRYLARRYLPDLERLSARFGGHAESWYTLALQEL